MATRIEKEKEVNASTLVTNFRDHLTCSGSSKEWRWDAEFAFFVLKQCIISRVLMFIIQFVMNVVVTDYPTDAFQGVPIPQAELSQVDRWIHIAFGGLTRWDAVHFLHIAQYGYTYESNLAFFPLYPTLIYSLTLIWSSFCAVRTTIVCVAAHTHQVDETCSARLHCVYFKSG
ncbi:hypothetical protein WUBG_08957 [Wuchereria bancrofti]|uniref:GPI mannosyltransferase 2 n=1 Tax=Wuchereria bancrofti TaxID=6293 RepID=J9AZW3_WUCBA|nr:hypothetical protein WUBG_08957 [Wuchereria bancrofti]